MKCKQVMGVFLGFFPHIYKDLTPFGELDRVSKQVDENLANPPGITNQRLGDLRLSIVTSAMDFPRFRCYL